MALSATAPAQIPDAPDRGVRQVLLLPGTTTIQTAGVTVPFSISVEGDPSGELWQAIRASLETHGDCAVIDATKLNKFKPGSILAVAPVLSRADMLRLSIPGKFRITYAVTLGFEVLNATTGQVLWSRTCTRDITAKFSEGDEEGPLREARPSFVQCLTACSAYLSEQFKKHCGQAALEMRPISVGPVPGTLLLDGGRKQGLMKNLALVLEKNGVARRVVVLHADDHQATIASKDAENPLEPALAGPESVVRLAGAQPMPSGIGGGLQFQITAATPPSSYVGCTAPACLDEMTLAAWMHDALSGHGKLQLLCPLPERGLVLQAQQLLLEVTQQSRRSVLDNMLRPDICIELRFGAGLVKRTRTTKGVTDFYSLDARMELRDFASGLVVASFFQRSTKVEESPFVFGKEWREVDSGPTFLDLARVLIQQLAEQAGPNIEASLVRIPITVEPPQPESTTLQASSVDVLARGLQSGRKFPLLATLSTGGTFPVGTARADSVADQATRFVCKLGTSIAEQSGHVLELPRARRTPSGGAANGSRAPVLRWLPAVWEIAGLAPETRSAAELRVRNAISGTTRIESVDVEAADEFNERMTKAFFVDDGGLADITSHERELRTSIPRCEPTIGVRLVVYRLDIIDTPAAKAEDPSRRTYDLGMRLLFSDIESGKELWRCSQGLEHPNEWREVLGSFVGERAADESSCVLVMIEEATAALISGLETDKEYKQQAGAKRRFSASGLDHHSR